MHIKILPLRSWHDNGDFSPVWVARMAMITAQSGSSTHASQA